MATPIRNDGAAVVAAARDLEPSSTDAGRSSAADLASLITREARSWLGTRFLHGAAVKGAGVDCVQHPRAVYCAVGLLPPDFPDQLPYPEGWYIEGGEARYDTALAEFFECRWRAGDGPLPAIGPGWLARFRVGRMGVHGGIVTVWPRVVHANAEIGEVVEGDATTNWLGRHKLMSLWRPRGLG